jgi:hypothetical protein
MRRASCKHSRRVNLIISQLVIPKYYPSGTTMSKEECGMFLWRSEDFENNENKMEA